MPSNVGACTALVLWLCKVVASRYSRWRNASPICSPAARWRCSPAAGRQATGRERSGARIRSYCDRCRGATSLQDGAAKSTRNIHRVPSCSVDLVAQRLAGIRERDAHNGILVITESLFLYGSDRPRFACVAERVP